jgi:hypothetical protein
VRVHYPECNIWCGERGHYLLSSGPQGEPFSHQEDGTMATPDLPAEPGWYRLTAGGWEPVPDDQAEAEAAAGGGWDLMHVRTMALAETPLF